MGKTGRMFCCERWDVTPHFMCLAKGFAAGFAPMAVVLTTSEIADVFRRPGHDFRHGHTYSGHPVSAAAVLAVLDIFDKEDLVERAARMGEYLGNRLEALYDLPIVGSVRGLGLLRAVELSADPESCQALPSDMKVGEFVRDWCYRNGMILRNNGDILVLAPALVVTEEIIDEIVSNIESGIRAAIEHFDLG
jgi:adenosylmethionine-8-amino-7-oxononanoate aminotransferase